MDQRPFIPDPLDPEDEENQIPNSSGSSSPCDSNVYSSDDDIDRNKKQPLNSKNQFPQGMKFDDLMRNIVDKHKEELIPRLKDMSGKKVDAPYNFNYEYKWNDQMNKDYTKGLCRLVDNDRDNRLSRRLGSDKPSKSIYPANYSHSPTRLVDHGDSLLANSEITGPRNSRNPVNQLCSKLLECRNLIEAIEFVEQNRRVIDLFTSIIREAPAYRNYDFSLYQIDYTVKDSFNPDFWLDREPIMTTADGNCQYHAVSLSLTGSESYTPQVRLATAVAVIDNREWFDQLLQFIDGGTVLDLVYTIARNYSWGDETTLKAIAVAINRRIFLYTCNLGKKDYELVKSLNGEELLDAFREKKYRGGTGIHAYADPLNNVNANDYIMLFHKSEHFIAVLPTSQQLTFFEPFNPILPVFS